MNHIQPPNFEATERDKFNNLIRKPSDTFRQFIVNVKHQAAKCNFGANLETMMRDRLVAGCNDVRVKRKLLAERALTYNEARTILEEQDNITRALHDDGLSEVMYARKAHRPTNASATANQPSSHPKRQQQHRQPSAAPSTTQKLGACLSCGGEHLRQSCKFRNAKCFKCQKIGHISKVCRSVSAKFVNHSEDVSSDNDAPIKTFHVNSSSHLIHDMAFDNGKICPFIIDTGSPINFMPLLKFEELQLGCKADLQRTDTTIRGVSGQTLPVIGKTNVRTEGESITFFVLLFFIKLIILISQLFCLRSLRASFQLI